MSGDVLVGYQTRLRSHHHKDCLLTFCSSYVFLNTLIDFSGCLKGITHLIIDQVHERDRYTDLLLGLLRIHLMPQFPHLRLILLSVSRASEKLAAFFNTISIVRIHALSKFHAKEYFLEDILMLTQFMSQTLNAKAVGPLHASDDLIISAWHKGLESNFVDFYKLVRNGSSSIDYQHSQTGATILQAAAVHGKVDMVKSALALGANPSLKVPLTG